MFTFLFEMQLNILLKNLKKSRKNLFRKFKKNPENSIDVNKK